MSAEDQKQMKQISSGSLSSVPSETQNMAHGNGNTCISEERLTVLMNKIFAEELEKQQQGLLKLINGNFEITVTVVTIKSETNELKKASNLQRKSW